MQKRVRSGAGRVLGPLTVCLALACAARAQVSGMTATVLGMEEVAGTGTGSHYCDVLVKFSGGPSDYNTGTSSAAYSWRFFVNSPHTILGGTNNISIKYGGAGSGEPSCGIVVTENLVVRLRFPASTVLGASIKGMLCGRGVYTWQELNPTTMQYETKSRNDFTEIDYVPFRLRSFPLEATSVTTRKTYAPPNAEGAYPAMDANAEKRNVPFAGWAYRGGLFLGNAAGVNADQSGVARVQCQATDPGSLPACLYTLSLLNIGAPSFFKQASTSWDGPMSVQAYVPSGTPGPNPPLASLTWANAMDPGSSTPQGAPADLPSANNQYLNVHLGEVGFPTRVLLKATDETAARWRYFCGSAYSPTTPAYPYSEGKPHLWACDKPTAGTPRVANSSPGITAPWLVSL